MMKNQTAMILIAFLCVLISITFLVSAISDEALRDLGRELGCERTFERHWYTLFVDFDVDYQCEGDRWPSSSLQDSDPR